jgi:aryl-alcohol dehydrogenase-like predicted oxidoreductase
VSEELVRQALHPYDGVTVATKGGLLRTGPNVWPICGRPDYRTPARSATSGLGGERRGASHAQLALAWLLRRSPVMLPIPGTGSVAHLEENCGAAVVELSDEDYDALTAAA